MSVTKVDRGWFAIEGVQAGERAVSEQLVGLEPVLERVAGRTILDLACAEGDIAFECRRRGARSVHGVEVVPKRVHLAKSRAPDRCFRFIVGDLNDLGRVYTRALAPEYDVVLALSILHKLKNPAASIALMASIVREVLAVRLPDPVIVDQRSGRVPFDVPTFLKRDNWFREVANHRGSRGEWIGVFEK